MNRSASATRRDTLVVRACSCAAVLQTVPPVVIAWLGYGHGAAADATLVALSSPVLLGVVAFGVVLAVALRQPGLEPRGDVAHGPVDDRASPPAGWSEPAVGLSSGPVRPGPPVTTWRARVRWAAAATVLQIAVTSAAVVLDDGARAGSASFGHALDDGSAAWAVGVLAFQGAFIDLRAPVAFGVAWAVLARALRPVRPGRASRRSRRWPAGRTTRCSPGPRGVRGG